MFRITAEGRRFLTIEEAKWVDRKTFTDQLDVGTDMVKLIQDAPEHKFSPTTIKKLCAFAPEFKLGVHYVAVEAADSCEIRLARDQSPTMRLSRRDQRGVTRLYRALLNNPEFEGLLPTFETPEIFDKWLQLWGNASEDPLSEQFLVYRLYQEKVIAFLYGELHAKTRHAPMALFAIWYLVGTTNAFYDGSPVGLDADDAEDLPTGEREAAVRFMVRLLEELRTERQIDCLIFEIEALELTRANSLGRRLLRLYAQAETEVKAHFASDPLLKSCQFFVLNFPYLVPQLEGVEVTMLEHRLICCPLKPDLRKTFQTGAVPLTIAANLLQSTYAMYWDCFDADAPERTAIRQQADAALAQFKQDTTKNGGAVACYALPNYVTRFFRGSSA